MRNANFRVFAKTFVRVLYKLIGFTIIRSYVSTKLEFESRLILIRYKSSRNYIYKRVTINYSKSYLTRFIAINNNIAFA